jgi:8-amino-7-oxononanoate synthase
MPNSRIISRMYASERSQLLEYIEKEKISPFYRVGQTAMSRVATMADRQVLMFGSNNYLGLAADDRVIEAGVRASRDYGNATTGSRLLNGTFELHRELEHELAQWHGTDSAVLFTTGFTTNTGAIAALARPGDLVVVDEYAHASIRDGAALSGARVEQFRHNDVDHLDEQIDREKHSEGEILVIVDGLYSMEGSLSPLRGIADIVGHHGAALMVDEAHSLGLYGARHRGWREETAVEHSVDVTMGSLSKALGSTGGFIAGSDELINGIRATARSLIFTTSATPSTVGSALESVRILLSPEGKLRVARLRENSGLLWRCLHENGLVEDSERTQWSPVAPVRIGGDLMTIDVWNRVLAAGAYVGLALYPAVPRDGAMLRLCVTSEHTAQDIRDVVCMIAGALAPALEAQAG